MKQKIAGMYGKWEKKPHHDPVQVAAENNRFVSRVFVLQTLIFAACAALSAWLYWSGWLKLHVNEDSLQPLLISVLIFCLCFLFLFGLTARRMVLFFALMLAVWAYMAFVVTLLWFILTGSDFTAFFAACDLMSCAYAVLARFRGTRVEVHEHILIALSAFLAIMIGNYHATTSSAPLVAGILGAIYFSHVARQNFSHLPKQNTIGNEGSWKDFQEQWMCAFLFCLSTLLLFIQLGRFSGRAGKARKSSVGGGGSSGGGGASMKW